MKISNNLIRILLAIVIGNIMAVMLLAFYLAQSKELYREIARITTSNLTRVLADSLSVDINLIDVVLQSTIDDLNGVNIHRPLKESEIDACLLRNKAKIPEINFFRTAEANGDVMHGIEPITAASPVLGLPGRG